MCAACAQSEDLADLDVHLRPVGSVPAVAAVPSGYWTGPLATVGCSVRASRGPAQAVMREPAPSEAAPASAAPEQDMPASLVMSHAAVADGAAAQTAAARDPEQSGLSAQWISRGLPGVVRGASMCRCCTLLPRTLRLRRGAAAGAAQAAGASTVA